jgi:hypothetical protein
VDPRERLGLLADEDVPSARVSTVCDLARRGAVLDLVDVRQERRAEPPDRERAEREERDVAEVEQAREADDDVQAERHDDVGHRERGVVEERAALVDPERQRAGDHDEDDRDDAVDAAALERLGDDAVLDDDGRRGRVAVRRLRAHPASLVSSPSRPCGLKTMIRIR